MEDSTQIILFEALPGKRDDVPHKHTLIRNPFMSDDVRHN
jgi:hypothetical protein